MADVAVRAPVRPGHRLAVLPLRNIGPDAKDEYLADGLTEELISALSRVEGLRVIARTSAMQFKGSSKRIREIGVELDVRSLLEGSVRISEHRIRISVQLIDAATEEQLWSSVYERPLQDIFEIQRDVAGRVARALKVRVPRDTGSRPATAPPNVDAYTIYLRARSVAAGRTDSRLREAIALYEQSLAADPRFAQSLAGAAEAYAALALIESMAPAVAFPRAREFAQRALALDPNLAEVHAARGLVKFQFDWDWVGAEEDFRRAVSLNPNLPQAHHYLADLLKAMGQFDAAAEEMRRALELDPLSLPIHTGLGHVLYLRRDYDGAIAQYRKALAMDPTFVNAHLWFGRPFLEKGLYADAIAEVSTAVDLSGGSTISLAVLAHVYASAGRASEARVILDRLLDRSRTAYLPSYWIALIYAGLGETEPALEWLGRAYTDRSSWLVWIGVEPRYDRLRSVPQFRELLERMRLPVLDPGSVPSRDSPGPDAARLLADLVELRLRRFQVVGDFLRFEDSTRNRLKDLAQSLLRSFSGRSTRRDTYLVWAPPGSGKTYFVREVARTAGEGAKFVELNLAGLEEAEFRGALDWAETAHDPLLVLVDEVDSKPAAHWPYELLLPFLDRAVDQPRPRVVVLAGSSGSSAGAFSDAISRRTKGADLLSRVPEGNRFALPGMTVGDRFLVAAEGLKTSAASIGKPVAEVEKLALYYLATNRDLDSPRQLREAVLRAVERIPEHEDRVRFDHLFAAGDRANKEFWVRAGKESPGLIDTYVRIEP